MEIVFLKLQDAITIFMGIIVSAIPFILLGVFLSAFLAHYIREERLLKIIPKNRFLAVLVACCIGFLFPVCECGNVPVARRLIKKGIPPYVAITFLLAAPVINPVTLFSTWAAFSFLPEVVFLRLAFSLVIAIGIGLLFSFHPKGEMLLADNAKPDSCKLDHGDTHNHTHHNDGYHVKFSRNRFWSFLRAIPEEFFEMMSALVIGGILASLIQAFIPKELLLTVGQGPFISILSMIVFALIISVCSTVDAFIALSYAGSFTTGAILAFLVFGPMIDLKSIWMLRTTFKWKTIIWLVVLIFLSTVLLTTAYNFYLN